jgi:stearoyl-CoA desaturase (delta-9 desaturase)
MAFGVGVPFFSLFLGIYLCWGRGLRLVDLIMMVGLYSLTILGITVGFHRMFTHRAYESGPVLRGILAIFGSMAGQGPVIEWCALHMPRLTSTDRSQRAYFSNTAASSAARAASR